MRPTIRLFVCLLALAEPSLAGAEKTLVNRDRSGLALQGYDPVAYFTVGRPTPGSAELTSRHLGATYRFASAEHKRLFDAEPAKYAPQFGGYCGYAASIDKLSPISPEFWQVLDGRLVLQHNQKAWNLWSVDVPGNLVKADANWPGLVARNGKPVKQLANLDGEGVALQGHDPVAYVQEGRPVPGSSEFTAVYDGSLYRFVSKANKDAFELDPARYEPQFGGYCAYAASLGKLAPVDPAVFQVVGGRLLLQNSRAAYEKFNARLEKNLAKADRNWPELVERHGR
jgi:YHS domain-containing protein